MKKCFALAFALILIIGLFGGTVAAGGEGPEGADTEEAGEPGLLPDSPFYFLKKIIEDIRVVLTFNKDNKTDLLAKLVDRRTFELQALEEKYADSELTAKQEKRLAKAAAALERSAERLFDRILGNDEDIEGEDLDERQILHLEKALNRIGRIIDRVAEDQCDGEECLQLQEKYRERVTKLEQIRDRNPDAQGLNRAIENAHRQQARWEERQNEDSGNPGKDKERDNDNNSENSNKEGKTKGKGNK